MGNSSSKEEEEGTPKYDKPAGPIHERSCKDIAFLILFIGYWIGMIVVSVLGIKSGNLDRLTHGNNTEGYLCGTKTDSVDLTAYPYVYVFNPSNFYSYRSCVAECPEKTGTINEGPYICTEGSQMPVGTVAFLRSYRSGNCTLQIATTEIMNRCIPKTDSLATYFSTLNTAGANTTGITANISRGTYDINSGQAVFQDVYNSWYIYVICLFGAMFFAYLWLFLIQYFGALMIWITVVGVNVACVAFTAYIWQQYAQQTNSYSLAEVKAQFSSTDTNEKLLLAICAICTIITIIVVLLTVFLRSRINLAAQMIAETSKAIRKVPFIVFFPALQYLVLSILTAFTVYVWAMLATSGTTVTDTLRSNGPSQIRTFESNDLYHGLAVYVLLGFFWTYDFLIAVETTTIAGAVATWYWTRDKKTLSNKPILDAFGRLYYHLGSLAFGSLIIAVVQTIRVIISYIQAHLKKSKSNWARYFLVCLQCVCACVESTLKYIAKNAYIIVAIYGKSFCSSCKHAFQLLTRNSIRVKVLNNVAYFLFFLGKLMITFFTAILGLAILHRTGTTTKLGGFWAISMLIILLIGWCVASTFVSVFEISLSTIFLSFCEDCERNDGSASRPYFMEDSLKKFVESTANKKTNMEAAPVVEKSKAANV